MKKLKRIYYFVFKQKVYKRARDIAIIRAHKKMIVLLMTKGLSIYSFLTKEDIRRADNLSDLLETKDKENDEF